jgi:hypothetical protein
MDINKIDEITKMLDSLVSELEAEIPKSNTGEQWKALHLLRDAARYTFSAARWLERDSERYSH